jgi:predicted DNA-binding helix-hairpin-helix protein
VWAQSAPTAAPPPPLPDLPDDAVVAIFGDGTKFTMGNFRKIYEALPPANQQMALRNREQFPVDLNAAPRETLLRVPGLGVGTVKKILRMRGHRRLRYEDLVKLRVSMRKVGPFVVTLDSRPRLDADSVALRAAVAAPRQPDLFGH